MGESQCFPHPSEKHQLHIILTLILGMIVSTNLVCCKARQFLPKSVETLLSSTSCDNCLALGMEAASEAFSEARSCAKYQDGFKLV